MMITVTTTAPEPPVTMTLELSGKEAKALMRFVGRLSLPKVKEIAGDADAFGITDEIYRHLSRALEQ